MKLIAFFGILLLSQISDILHAQNWAAPGAVWYYTFSNFTTAEYVKIEKISDTLINGRTCDVLKKTRIGFNYITSQNETISLGREYTRLSNDTVYNFRNNQFYILYCFNAAPGDKWLIAGNNINCSVTDTIKVDSIGTTTLNSTLLRYVWTSPSSANGWKYANKVIEKIGCKDYMFPEPHCATDLNEGGPLRCYDDSSGWSYQTWIVANCDYTTGIDEQSNALINIIVYPNPSHGKITIEKLISKKIFLSLFNIYGQEIKKAELSANKSEVDLIDQPSGIYFLSIVNENGIRITKKIIKE